MSRRKAEFHMQISSSSSGSDISSSSTGNETPASRFNQLLRRSVARHWRYLRYFRHDRSLTTRGRSVSDNGLCGIVDHDPDLDYLSIPVVVPRRSLQGFTSESAPAIIPSIYYSSAGGAGSAVGLEEASDGSDADRPRRGHHLRVPTPAFTGQSTGNFASGAAGGGCGAPRSAPATPLQLEPHPRKHDKTQVVKPFTGSAPSVRAPGPAESGETSDGKQPYKSRQKKFFRHFPQVGPEERVLNYYSCALVGDLLLQGHLYITKNYFAFYSNVFGYVTKLLIPTSSVQRITKEKVARIIPNAVGVATRDERHVFGSLLSRDTTYKLMTHVWKNARQEVTAKSEDLRASEVELDPSEYSDDSSSDHTDAPIPRPEPDAIIAAASAAVVQPNLQPKPSGAGWTILALLTLILLASAIYLAHSLYTTQYQTQEEISKLSGSELYSELVRWRARLHGRAAQELHAFLTTNLLLLTKVRQSLETLSEVILTDMAQGVPMQGEVPNDTVYS